MGKSRIMIFVESVVDGTIGVEQVWQTYGEEIRSTSNLSTEEDVLALTELYLRYANFLANNGYLKDAEVYYSDSLRILDNEKSKLSDDNFRSWSEVPLRCLASIYAQLEKYKEALPYLKQLKDMYPRKDEYRQDYYGCLRSAIAKYTTPIYIVIAIIFLLDIAESYFQDVQIIPDWLLDVSWSIWVVSIIVQFGLPWVMNKVMK